MNRLAAFSRHFIWTALDLLNFQNMFRILIFLLSALILTRIIISSSSFQVILIPVGAFFLYISVKKPEIGILVIIVIVASIIFESAVPLLPIPGGKVHFTDIILLALLLRIPIKVWTDRSFRLSRTPLDLPLLLFILAAFVSAGVSIFVYGLDYRRIISTPLRTILYYLIFFAITNLVREKKQIRFLLNSLLWLGTFVALAMIIQARVGDSVRLLPGRVEGASQISWAARIIPPGDSVILVTFFLAVCVVTITKKSPFRTIHFYLIPIYGAGLLLTYNRNYWISIALSLFIFVFLLSERSKKRFFGWLAIVLICVILVALPLSRLSNTVRAYSDSIFERFSTLFIAEESWEGGSLGWRKLENQYATQSIVRHPFLGVGLWNYYRPAVGAYASDWTRIYIHNGYLYILLNMGLLGFLPFIYLYIRFLFRGLSNWRKIRDPIEKSAVMGLMLSGIAFAVVNLVSPKFMERAGMVVTATILGLSEAIIRRNKMESQENER
jgi:hypothetical protein